MKQMSVLLFLICLLLLSAVGCGVTAQTPQTVVVTATPEPTATANPGPTVPTWTPGPTWTPQPSPTPTKTPFPTPTPTLQELALMNAPECITRYGRERHSNNDLKPYEAIASEEGIALIKAGYYGDVGTQCPWTRVQCPHKALRILAIRARTCPWHFRLQGNQLRGISHTNASSTWR